MKISQYLLEVIVVSLENPLTPESGTSPGRGQRRPMPWTHIGYGPCLSQCLPEICSKSLLTVFLLSSPTILHHPFTSTITITQRTFPGVSGRDVEGASSSVWENLPPWTEVMMLPQSVPGLRALSSVVVPLTDSCPSLSCPPYGWPPSDKAGKSCGASLLLPYIWTQGEGQGRACSKFLLSVVASLLMPFSCPTRVFLPSQVP